MTELHPQLLIHAPDSHVILQILMDNSSDLVYIGDSESNIIDANGVFIDLFPEDQRDDIVGASIHDLLPPSAAKAAIEQDKIAFIKRSSRVVESHVMTNGQVRIFDMHRICFDGTDGAQFILAMGRDVTEREHMIGLLAKTSEEMEKFAFVASHDLNEPLRMINSFTQLLQEQYGDKLDDNARKFMSITLESVNQMQGLMDDLLTHCQVGEESVNTVEVNAERILGSVLSNLEESITLCKAEVSFGELPTFTGNPLRFSRVLQTLISNGLKYRAENDLPKIVINAKDSGDEWLFEVQDNGIGMKKEYCRQIFLPFKRLHSRSTYPGFGLGLSICQRAVESMGGLIWAESECDVGSVFSFTVPKTPCTNPSN